MKALGTLVLTGTLALIIGGCAEQKKNPVVSPVEPAAEMAPTATPAYPAVGSQPSGMTANSLAQPTMPPADLSAPAPVDLEPAPSQARVAPLATHTTAARKTSSRSASAAAVSQHEATAHGTHYVVKKGDTLSKIAKAHYGRATHSNIRKIIEANPSLKKNPNLIKVGQTLILP